MSNKKPADDELNRADSPYASPQSDTGGASTFSLASLLAFIAICAVGFGFTYYAVGLGVAFFIIAILAFVRVKFHRQTAWVRGIEATALSVVLVVVLIPICCSVAFFTNCLAGVFAVDQLRFFDSGTSVDWVMLVAFGLGGITALQVAEMLFAFLLRKKSHETS